MGAIYGEKISETSQNKRGGGKAAVMVRRMLKEFFLMLFLFALIVIAFYSLPIQYLMYLRARKKYGYVGSFTDWLEDLWGA